MSGLDAPVSPCLQLRLRRFPPSLPSPSVSSSLPAPTCSASTSGSDCPPPARLTRAKVRATVHYSQGSARAGKTVIHRISVRASGSCRGLRPCPLCHLCPATATAIAVAASGPKQHRPSDERPLRPRCEVQRHHPPEGSCRGYIYLFIGSSRACARLLYLSSMDSERHTQTDDLEHLEASQKAVIIVLKTEQLHTGNFFKQFSLFIDNHLFISNIFAKFTYPFRDAEGLILTKISRYETDKIQDF